MIVPVIGFLGSILLLTAYFLAASGKIPAQGYMYLIMNLSAGALLFMYSLLIMSWPFMFLNTVWVLIAFGGMYKVWKAQQSGRV